MAEKNKERKDKALRDVLMLKEAFDSIPKGSKIIWKQLYKDTNLPRRTIDKYLRVRKEGSPELIQGVHNGDINLSSANFFLRTFGEKERDILIADLGIKGVADKCIELEGGVRGRGEGNKINYIVPKDRFSIPLDKDESKLISEVYGKDTCMMPNSLDLYCQDCKWTFKIQLPAPKPVIHCPYCLKPNIVNTPPTWHHRYESAKAIKRQQEEQL